jgi:hypothetical protein
MWRRPFIAVVLALGIAVTVAWGSRGALVFAFYAGIPVLISAALTIGDRAGDRARRRYRR